MKRPIKRMDNGGKTPTGPSGWKKASGVDSSTTNTTLEQRRNFKKGGTTTKPALTLKRRK